MNLICRAATQKDFTAFYESCYFRDRVNVSLRAIVAHEWQALLKNPNTLSLVMEDVARREDQRLVGCCQLVFVTDGFVSWSESAPSPGGNVQATHPLPDGSWPLLTPSEVAAANAEAGLNALFTRWARADALLSLEEKRGVGRVMHDAFMSLTRGYQFREILIDVIGEPAREAALRAGFLDRNRYEAHFAEHPVPDTQRPFLMGITRSEAFTRDGYVMSHYFSHVSPRFGLSPREQEMLDACLRLPEATNEDLAHALGASLNTVKNRWLSIYRRVGSVDPWLLPPDANTGRGPEKRRRLIQYLREHLEELRPYKPQHKPSRRKRCPANSPM